MEQFFQLGEKHSLIVIWSVAQIGKAINDEFVIWDRRKFFLIQWFNVSPLSFVPQWVRGDTQ